MTNTYKGKSLTLGGGGRAAKLTTKLDAKELPKSEIGGIIHNQGVAKYGQNQMTNWSKTGKTRAEKIAQKSIKK
jgi:Zn-dependent M32 family carboxypeptidase